MNHRAAADMANAVKEKIESIGFVSGGSRGVGLGQGVTSLAQNVDHPRRGQWSVCADEFL